MGTESEIITAILNGETDRFRELIDRYQKMVYGVAWSHLGNLDLTEEAVQESFVNAFRFLATLKDRTKFSGWLATIARNISLALRRSRKQELARHVQWEINEIADTNEATAKHSPVDSPSDQLQQTLSQLPDIHRESLTLFYLEGRNIQQLADTLNLSESAVKTRLYRARQALREEMEKKLGDALEQMRPAPNTTAAIMAILPVAPIGVGSSLAGAGKLTAAIAKFSASFSIHLWMLLAQFAPFSFLISWFSRNQAENIVDAPEQSFRKTLWKQHAITVIVMAVIVGSISYAFTKKLGAEFIFQILSVYSLYGFWMISRLLKVNRSRFAKGQVLMLAVMFLSCVLVGFFEFPAFTFVGGMIVVNLILASAHEEFPQRMDYNLFLRAATGGLRDVRDQADTDPQKLSSAQLKAFANLLGEMWLVRDYRLEPGGITLRIPPVRNSFLDFILSTGLSRSSCIFISHSGRCAAIVGGKDVSDIERLQGESVSPEELTVLVKRSLEEALNLFVAGRTAEARQTLCNIPDEEIFKSTTKSNKSFKTLCYISLGAGIVSLTLFALIHVLTN